MGPPFSVPPRGGKLTLLLLLLLFVVVLACSVGSAEAHTIIVKSGKSLYNVSLHILIAFLLHSFFGNDDVKLAIVYVSEKFYILRGVSAV